MNLLNTILPVVIKASNILIAIGTILSLVSLRVESSPIETTYIKGKPKNNALIAVLKPGLLKIGVFCLVVGSFIQIIINIFS